MFCNTANTLKRYDRPTIGDLFPTLKGSTQMDDDFDLYEYMGNDKWGLIFMHPGDFTPVCTTEVAATTCFCPSFCYFWEFFSRPPGGLPSSQCSHMIISDPDIYIKSNAASLPAPVRFGCLTPWLSSIIPGATQPSWQLT
jgi:hypothetical protein